MREPSWTDGQASTSTAGYSSVYRIGSTVTEARLDWTFPNQGIPYFLRGLGDGLGLDRRAAEEEPLRLVDDWTRLLGVVEEDLEGAALGVADRLELDGCGPAMRLGEDREVVLRLVGAGLTDFRTGAERGDALRDELGTLRRTLVFGAVEGTGLVTDDDRPGSDLLRLVVGAGVRLLVDGVVRTRVRLGTTRLGMDDPRLTVGAG